MSDTEESPASPGSENSSIQLRVKIVNFAIDEVWDNVSNTDDNRTLTNKVLDKLLYYFLIKKKMDKSEEFVENVINVADNIQTELGGRYESALAQALHSYKPYIEEEIRSETRSSDESNSESENSDETEAPEEAMQTNDDDSNSEWSSVVPSH